ncbi:hypothetical protein JXA63_03710 [Candidatus Woesebacteria bacterium]|nr:hypothetical protein [Candidatus Woesebacteria bacterium]
MSTQLIPPAQKKLLGIFLENPESEYYTNELIRITGEYPNTVQYALSSLKEQKLLKTKRVNNKKFYWLNESNPILNEIKEILIKKGIINQSTREQSLSGWIKLLNREASLAFQAETPLVNRDILPQVIDYSIKNFWYNGITYGVYYQQEELKELADAVHTKIQEDPKFVDTNVKNCYSLGKELLQISENIKLKELKKLSNKELLYLLSNFRSTYQKFLPYLVYPHAIERYFIGKIKEELKTSLSKVKRHSEFEEMLNTLTSPVNHDIEEQIDMMKVAEKIKEQGITKKVKENIRDIHKKYCWQTFWTVEAEPLTYQYYKDALIALSQTDKSIKKEIGIIKKEQKNREYALQRTLNEIKASQNLIDLVAMLQAYINIRTYRKNVISKAHYLHYPLLQEIGKRMDIGKDIDFIAYDEMVNFLENDNNVSKVLLRKRKQGWGVIAVDGNINVVSGLNEVLEIMEQFQIGQKPIVSSAKQVIKGNPACRGKVTGAVKIIKSVKELNRIEQDDILVTSMTTPDFVPAFGKIMGIITDEGGITCHAAIVSREYNIPCIVGTGNATKILQDGGFVELDAFSGEITILDNKSGKSQSDVLKGQTLYNGVIEGKVVKIDSDEDLEKVTKDSIIVSGTITPRYLSALYKAKGFVVDEFSPTSHPYLYAKAIKIPSIGGTKVATKILKTGDKIKLNANKGYIKLL